MDVRQLRNFLAVQEFRNFTRAAASLHLSQPALSSSISQLERELGTTLFVRRRRAIDLTAAGEALLPAARRAVRAIADAEQAVAEVENLEAGRLEVAAPPALMSFPTAGLVARFTARYPGVRVTVREAVDSKDAAQRVLDGRAEVAVLDLRRSRRGLVTHPLTTYRIMLAGFPGDRDVPARVTLRGLAGYPLVCSPPGTGIRQIVDGAGLGGSIRIETRSVDAILEHVLEGKLFALMIEPYAQRAQAAGASAWNLEPEQKRKIGLVTVPTVVSMAVARFVATAEEQAQTSSGT